MSVIRTPNRYKCDVCGNYIDGHNSTYQGDIHIDTEKDLDVFLDVVVELCGPDSSDCDICNKCAAKAVEQFKKHLLRDGGEG